MPANPILGLHDLLEFTVKGRSTAGNQMVLNRTYWQVNAVPGTPVDDLLDYLDDMRTLWQGAMLTVLSVDYHVDEYIAKRVSGITPYAGPGTPFNLIYDAAVTRSPIGDDGTIAGNPNPSFIAASVRFQTGFVGRYWRGGMRMGTLPSSYRDIALGKTNEWLAAPLTNMQAAINLLVAGVTSAGGNTYKLTVFSPTWWYEIQLGTGTAYASSADVIAGTVSNFVRHQDSRQAPKVP